MNMLLLLSHFSRVWLCVTSWMAAHQASPSLEFSRQEHWSGLSFPSPMHESEKWKSSRLCPTLSDPMDCSLPGFSIRGIFQVRVLDWGAIAYMLYIYPFPPTPPPHPSRSSQSSELSSLCYVAGFYQLSISHMVAYISEKAMATHSSTLAWRIPGTGEPGGLPESDTTEAT